MNTQMKFLDWGLVEYTKALTDQEFLVEQIAAENAPGVLVFCTHPEVVTLGRKTQEGDVFDFNGPVIEVQRGGRATYHGPSQLVIYPIFNLSVERDGKPSQDLAWYLRTFEQAIVNVLKEYGIQSQGRSLQKKAYDVKGEEETGVWVGSQKIASLGIGVRKWVSFHGAALNVDEDPRAFQGLKPCGFTRDTMVSMEKLVGKKIDRDELKTKLRASLLLSL